MDKLQKLLNYILMKKGDSNVPFSALCRLLIQLGFVQRIQGDHHIFTKTEPAEIINLQPKGAKAKVYQVKQVRDLILRYGFKLEE